MTTLGPTLDATGISVPDYSDIFTQLQNAYLQIYGTDSDLDPDSLDGQFLAIFARVISDCDNAAQDVYNAFSLNTAQGAGLSSLVKLVGVRRAVAGFSTDQLTIVGTVGTTISGGQVGDSLGQGTIWNLPSTVNIPGSGTITVAITNTVPGPATFEPGQIATILTPTQGWQTASNVGPAVAGAAVQGDAALREAATNAVGGPASTILEAIFAAINNVANVTRFTVYENDTDVNDANGQGPHSIYAVVQGGVVQDIVNAIGETKSPGTTTLGTTSGTFIDQNGVPDLIHFYQLTLVTITVVVNIQRLNGYTSATAGYIQQAVAAYLSGASIGEISYLGRLYSPSNLSGDAAVTATGLTQTQLDALSLTYDVTSILQSRVSDAPPAAQNVPIAFNEASICTILNVTVNAV
jgi:uncharacterized phage protein gp47/JayE